jgi:hypothetical protein
MPSSHSQHANTLIIQYFHHSIVFLAIGFDAFKDRLGRLLTQRMAPECHLSRDPNEAIVYFFSEPNLYASYGTMHPLLSQNCVASPHFLFSGNDPSDTVLCPDGLWRYLLDVAAPHRGLIVPMNIFRPYLNNLTRAERVIAGLNLIPFFFITAQGTIGAPVIGNFEQLDCRRMFREPRTSLKIKFHWPGYEPYEGQIQYNPVARGGAVQISARRLAELVAGQVQSFLQKATERSVHHIANEGWDIGRHHGGIQAHNLILLGVISVSEGAVMPLLQRC